MKKSFLLIVTVCIVVCAAAQQRRIIPPGGNAPLLRELQLSQKQRIQLKELIREQRVRQKLYELRLQQILTPEQQERLKQYLQRKAMEDSLAGIKKP